MLELLRDPLWQFVGAALAVAALIASFVIYRLQRLRKGVTYDVLSRTNLLTVREELEGKLQVLYEGEPAKSLSLLVLKLWNSGNQPILATDYERPISFGTGEASRLLTADVTEAEPLGLQVDYEISGNKLVLKPMLLNPGDSVTLKLLVRDAGARLVPDSRIVGVKSLHRLGDGSKLFPALTTVGMLLIAVGFYLFIGYFPRNPSKLPLPPPSPTSLVGITLAAVGYIIMAYALVKVRRIRIRVVRFVRGG